MGKESRLRNPQKTSRYNHTNGDRKLYDRDAMPEGLDSDVWHLTLYFEDIAEKYGCLTPGRPIVYTELYNRISKDSELSKLLRSEDAQYTRTHDTDGITSVLEEMIDYFFHSGIYDYDNYVINTFTARINFDYIRDYVLETNRFKVLINTGKRVVQPDREIKPSRKTEEEKIEFEILTRDYSEEELKEKLEYWKRNSS